jgi:hypothetical protein
MIRVPYWYLYSHVQFSLTLRVPCEVWQQRQGNLLYITVHFFKTGNGMIELCCTYRYRQYLLVPYRNGAYSEYQSINGEISLQAKRGIVIRNRGIIEKVKHQSIASANYCTVPPPASPLNRKFHPKGIQDKLSSEADSPAMRQTEPTDSTHTHLL